MHDELFPFEMVVQTVFGVRTRTLFRNIHRDRMYAQWNRPTSMTTIVNDYLLKNWRQLLINVSFVFGAHSHVGIVLVGAFQHNSSTVK